MSWTARTFLQRACRSALAAIALPVIALLFTSPEADAQARNTPPIETAPLRFGILPIGGAVESRDDWVPLLDALRIAIHRPVSVRSVPSYEALQQAIRRNEIDLAVLSGKLALDAVTERRMNVIAEVVRNRDAPEHRAVLLARKAPPLDTLDKMLASPEQWRLARGDHRSMTGFVLPQLLLFLPNKIVMETRFRSELIENHQNTALAVANGDADVATNNTTDFERFKRNFPAEAERLQIIWRSEPTPPLVFLARRELPAELQKSIQSFVIGYGRKPGPEIERDVLRNLHTGRGYAAADNSALLAVADLEYRLERQRAISAQWVDEAARQARLARIERNRGQIEVLLKSGAR